VPGASNLENGKRYESFFVFNYKELLPGNTDTLYKSIRWSIGVEKDNSGEESYSGDKFYSNLVAELDDIPGVKRWAGLVNIIVACGSGTLNSYIETGFFYYIADMPFVNTSIKMSVVIRSSRYLNNKTFQLLGKLVRFL